jgi:hypothetical protein
MHVEDKDLVTALSQQPGGPPLTAAVYARVGTAVSFTRRLGPLGNYLVARPAARAAAHRDGERADTPLTIAFADGESVNLEARGDVRGFVTAFEQHRDIAAT